MTTPDDEIWERHPVYPHEGSSLGRARSLRGKILAQRTNNQPPGATPDWQYQLIDIWMPRPPCQQQPDGRWKHLPKPQCRCKETVSVHSFITECHWGMKRFRRQVARHRPGGSPADNRWENLLGWGFPEDNNGPDKPQEVRIAAAKAARAAQLAAMPRRKRRRKWRRVTLLTVRLPLPRRKKRTVTAGRETVSKPITNESVVTGR